MRTTSLEWALGIFIAGVGTFMLVAPHQFSAGGYDAVRPALPWWGAGFCLAGMALLAVPVYALAHWLRLAAHTIAAAALWSLAFSFGATGIWGSAAGYAVLGAASASAALAPAGPHAPLAPAGRRRPDLLALAMGAIALLHSVALLAIPAAYRVPTYDPIRANAAFFGVAFLAAGMGLLATQLLGRRLAPAPSAMAHALAAAVFLLWAAALMLPNRAWTGVALYGGVGAVVGLLPWLQRAAPLMASSSSLRSRLALALAVAAAAPLILAATLIARQEERAALEEALARQQAFAGILAQDTAQYVGLHRSAVAALASQVALLAPDPGEQTWLLDSVSTAYPALSFLSTFDERGGGIARSTARAPEAVARLPVFEEARLSHAPAADVLLRQELSPAPLFALAAPVMRDGQFDGIVLGAVESVRLTDLLASPRMGAGSETYLVDSLGRAIAHPDLSLAASLADFSRLPPVAALLAQDDAPRAMRYRGWGGERLVGYARVPSLGWGVVVERPASVVLADSFARRDLIFGLLVLAITLAAAAGWVAAGQLTRSLSALARAADALAAERTDAPLPRSTAAELDRLAAAFGAMRDRLAARTAEREEAIRMRDNVLGTVSHDLKNPLTTIALRADVLQEEATELLQASEAREAMGMPAAPALTTVAAAAGRTAGAGGHAISTPADADRGIPSRVAAVLDAELTDRLAGVADGLGRIVATTQKMHSMIDELVDTARLHSGQRLDLTLRPVDLTALAQAVVEEYRHTAERHQLTFDSPDGTLVGSWDQARLERVLHNVIGNAIKYSPQGGAVAVAARRVLEPGGAAWAEVAVSDQGMGIPESELPRLFQRFYRASNVAGTIRGTGLGLYSAREIVLQHGGAVNVQSREGHGTTFTIRLPLQHSTP